MNDGFKGGPVFGKEGEEKGVRWLVTVETKITKCDEHGSAIGDGPASRSHNASVYVETENIADMMTRAACASLFEV